MRDARPRFMTAQEVAAELRVTLRWLKRHRKELPFAVRLAPTSKAWVYHRAAFERWAAVAGAGGGTNMP